MSKKSFSIRKLDASYIVTTSLVSLEPLAQSLKDHISRSENHAGLRTSTDNDSVGNGPCHARMNPSACTRYDANEDRVLLLWHLISTTTTTSQARSYQTMQMAAICEADVELSPISVLPHRELACQARVVQVI